MPACESKLESRSSRKATVAKTVFVEYAQVSHSLVGDRGQVLRVLSWALTRMRNSVLVVLHCGTQGS